MKYFLDSLIYVVVWITNYFHPKKSDSQKEYAFWGVLIIPIVLIGFSFGYPLGLLLASRNVILEDEIVTIQKVLGVVLYVLFGLAFFWEDRWKIIHEKVCAESKESRKKRVISLLILFLSLIMLSILV